MNSNISVTSEHILVGIHYGKQKGKPWKQPYFQQEDYSPWLMSCKTPVQFWGSATSFSCCLGKQSQVPEDTEFDCKITLMLTKSIFCSIIHLDFLLSRANYCFTIIITLMEEQLRAATPILKYNAAPREPKTCSLWCAALLTSLNRADQVTQWQLSIACQKSKPTVR